MSSVKILLVVVLCCTLVYSQNDTEHKQGRDSSDEGRDDYNNDHNGSDDWWIILLGVLGGIALLLVVLCTIYCCCCHKKTTGPANSVAQVNDNAAYDVKIDVNVAPRPPYAISRSGSMIKVAPYDGPPAGDPPGYRASSVPPPPYQGNEHSTIQV